MSRAVQTMQGFLAGVLLGLILGAALGSALKAAGIGPHRFHDLRGTSATLLRELGVSAETRMARLGHNSYTMARLYAKASEEQDRRAVARLGRALG